MSYRLNTFVHVVEVGDNNAPTGRSATFGPEDDLSAADNRWALPAISNPDVWQGEAPPAPEPVPAAAAPAAGEQAAHRSAGSQPARVEVPPRSGPGSGVDRWRAYADAQGVDVPDNASREDVIKALESVQKPTE